MPILDSEKRKLFQEQGFILLENAIDSQLLKGLQRDFNGWVKDSINHSKPYGKMLDGRPRFDLDSGHRQERPALRRVASPTEISSICLSVVCSSYATQAVVELIGPDVRFHHSKFNSKMPGSETVVKWHQDFTFDPCSNDDSITIIVFVDNVTETNGVIMLSPGSHKGPLYSLWQDTVFTGALNEDIASEMEKTAVPCVGKAGDVCLMHSRVAHASKLNQTNQPRTLFIYNLIAADAIPLVPNAVPSKHTGMLVSGKEPGRIRTTSFDIEMPEVPKNASFFNQQTQAK